MSSHTNSPSKYLQRRQDFDRLAEEARHRLEEKLLEFRKRNLPDQATPQDVADLQKLADEYRNILHQRSKGGDLSELGSF